MAKIYWFCSDEQFQPEVLVKHAIAAENAGFDGVMISEHFHPWVDDVGTAGFSYSTLGAIANATSKVGLMTAVTVPLFRFHPAIVAQAAATIDRLSNGRFQLGIGTGENINEAPLGFELPSYNERAARLKEAIQIIRSLLDSEKIDFEGKYYNTKSAKLYSPPISHIPIYLAAGGQQSAITAGELCEGVMTSVKDINDTYERVIEPARQSSRSNEFKTIITKWSVFAKSQDEAWEALKAQRGLRAPSRATATDPKQLQDEADNLPKSDVLSKYAHLSSAQDYISEYSPLVTELGADIVGIQTTSLDQIALIEMLGIKVVPELKQLTKRTGN